MRPEPGGVCCHRIVRQTFDAFTFEPEALSGRQFQLQAVVIDLAARAAGGNERTDRLQQGQHRWRRLKVHRGK